jgi:gluconolactonase
MLDQFETLAIDLDHPECASWGIDGRIWAGGEAGQIYSISLSGEVEQVATTGGFIYGITVDGSSNVYACDFGNAAIMRISPAGEVSEYSRGTDERPLRVPNFACFDDDGNLFVTDSGEWGKDDGLVFRIQPSGRTSVWSDKTPAFPNGCCLTAEGDALLIIESRARRIVRVPILDDAIAGTPEPLADLSGSQPDGLALADDGTMFVGCYRPDRVWRIPYEGAPEVWAEDPDGVVLNQPANVSFVGPELDRMVVSSLGGWSLMVVDPGVRGLPLRYPNL